MPFLARNSLSSHYSFQALGWLVLFQLLSRVSHAIVVCRSAYVEGQLQSSTMEVNCHQISLRARDIFRISHLSPVILRSLMIAQLSINFIISQSIRPPTLIDHLHALFCINLSRLDHEKRIRKEQKRVHPCLTK